MKNGFQEVPKSNCNKTDIIETDDSIPSYPVISSEQRIPEKKDVIREMEAYRETIRGRIEYQLHNGPEVDELVELMVEVMMMPDDAVIKIGGIDKPAALIKNRFMQISYSHIEYVLFSLQKNTTKVGNIKAYLLTTLYNATMTISNYYHAEVNC